MFGKVEHNATSSNHSSPPSCHQVVGLIGGLGLQWQASFTIITLLYFYSHYLFASGAAHIGAMYTAFLSVSIAMGTPPLVVRLFASRAASSG